MDSEIKKNLCKILMPALIISLLLAGCYASTALIGKQKLPLRHSDEGKDLSMCTECHEEEDKGFPYGRFDHNKSFADRHGAAADNATDVCTMCHAQSFCSDCHGVGVELKPSAKNYTGVNRGMPHRGDYITIHRIEGRIDPASCVRCHGNPKTQRSCKPCHG